MKCEIIHNVFLKEKYLLLELSVPAGLRVALPGQFLHVRVNDSCAPLLRRPLSIHDLSDLSKKKRMMLSILYEVRGKGTAFLADKKPLSVIDVLGPMGNGFDLKKIASYEKIYIVAGGMGVAPLFFLARKIVEIKNQKSKIKIIVLIGAKTKGCIFREKEFKDLGCEVHIATDDGSRGFKGLVTDLLNKELSSIVPACPAGRHRPSSLPVRQAGIVCSCGPKPMLKAVADVSKNYGLKAYVSLEEFMGCGLGACLGCVIRTTSGYKRICHDGPVFDASEIIWRE